jgi:DNA (cytosine-5)-methyltransferase 1
MKHGSLFSGIGGAELAASWMGWENVFHCEINKYNQKLLKQHFPQSIAYEDIKKTDFTIHRGGIDILTGGFPCQPFSTAGTKQGTDDNRNLWPEMFRAIREISPRWIVGENVRGLTYWNGGMVFDQVQADMEAEGYEIIPFLFPASAVGACHKRERIWFIAHTNFIRQQGQGRPLYAVHTEKKEDRQTHRTVNVMGWPTEPAICRTNDGLSNRMDRLTGLGNAWVPQAALQIFKAIEQYELLSPSKP